MNPYLIICMFVFFFFLVLCRKPATWARLGDVSKYSNSNNTNSKFYDIVEIVVHPNYDRSYVYNDIALFRLGATVSFTAYIRPICLNADPSLNFKTASAAGWGRISVGECFYHGCVKAHRKRVEK